jgi:hypothetical protein
METQTKTQLIITFKNSISEEEIGKILRKASNPGDYWSVVGRYRENTQENIRHCGLLISG